MKQTEIDKLWNEAAELQRIDDNLNSPAITYVSRKNFNAVLSTLPDAPALTDEQWKRIRAVANAIRFNSYQSEADNARRREIDSLARRPTAQAPTAPTCPHGKAADVFCQYCSDLRAINSAQSMPASLIQTSEAEGDVVNIMLTAYDLAYKPEVGGHNHAMRAAYAVSRQHFAAHPPEGSFTKEQVEKAVIEEFKAWRSTKEYHLDEIPAKLIARLTALLKPTPQERVEALLLNRITGFKGGSKAVAAEIDAIYKPEAH